MDTVFPIILRVEGGLIKPACTCFGGSVSDISDLLCRSDRRGAFEPQLVELVKEVTATRTAAKRILYIWARGELEEFFCSICVFFDTNSNLTVIGVEIRENLSMSAADHDDAHALEHVDVLGEYERGANPSSWFGPDFIRSLNAENQTVTARTEHETTSSSDAPRGSLHSSGDSRGCLSYGAGTSTDGELLHRDKMTWSL